MNICVTDYHEYVLFVVTTIRSSFFIYYRICSKGKRASATSGTGTAYVSIAPGFPPIYFFVELVCSISSFMCNCGL